MAYVPANLQIMAGEIWDRGRQRIWAYRHTDAMSVVRAANYIADARDRGMVAGDIILVTQMTGTTVTAQTLASVLTVGASGADLSDGTAITMTNS